MQNYQENKWRGTFGDCYIERNQAVDKVTARRLMWQEIFKSFEKMPRSIAEVGANVGINIKVLAEMLPAELHAIEPNEKARTLLAGSGLVKTENIHDAIASQIPMQDKSVELSFTSGVLIHVPPEDLLESCREIHRISSDYILCIEYFNPTPVEVAYHGEQRLLFKRDFGSFWLDHFSDLKVVDYGFFWRRMSDLDDLTWWLFQKT